MHVMSQIVFTSN